MKCVIKEVNERNLRIAIAAQLNNKIKAGELLDLKAYMQDLYNKVSAKKDHETALNTVRLIPGMINQLTGVSDDILDLVAESEIPELLKLASSIKKDNSLKTVASYLELSDNTELVAKKATVEIIKEANKKTEVKPKKKDTVTEIAEDFEDGAPKETPVLPEKKESKKGLDIEALNEIEQIDPADVELPSLNKADKAKQYFEKNPDSDVLDFAAWRKATGVSQDAMYNHSTEVYKDYDNYIEKQYEEAILKEEQVKQAELEQAKLIKAAEIKEAREKEEIAKEKTTPKESPTKVNMFQKVALDVRDKLLGLWEAAAPTFFADGVLETKYFKKKDKASKNFRAVQEQEKFFYKVKRNILKEIAKQNIDQDSSNLTIGAHKGIFLTAKNVTQVETGNDIDMSEDPNEEGVLLVITNTHGEELRFDEDGMPTEAENGRVAYFKLRSSEKYLDANGNLDTKKASALISSLTSLSGMKRIDAIKQLTRELHSIKTIREHINKNKTKNSLKLNINGGSLGYIKTSYNTKTPLDKVNDDVSFKIADDAMVAKERKASLKGEDKAAVKKGGLYVTSPELHGQYILVERPDIKGSGHEETILSLLRDKLLNHAGAPLSYEERREALRTFINVSDKETARKGGKGSVNFQGILMKRIADTKGDYQIIIGKEVVFDSTKGEEDFDKIEKAFAKLLVATKQTTAYTEYDQRQGKIKGKVIKPSEETTGKVGDVIEITPGKYWRKLGHAFTMHVNETHLKEGHVNVPVIKDGVVTMEKQFYRNFLNQNKFQVATDEVSSDGSLRRLNAYFTFELTEEANEMLNEKETVSEEIVEAEKKADEKLTKEISDKTDRVPSKTDSIVDSFLDNDFVLKRLSVKDQNKPVTEKQIRDARTWYENHPLSKLVPFEAMFDKVNANHTDAAAEWTLAGINLYKSSDYTDLYHESWHAFTQGLMTQKQKDELYDEVSKRTGNFTDYNGRRVSFKFATDLQIEEYLAEEFRSYMLNGQKAKTSAPKQNSFFQKVWNILKTIFTEVTAKEIIYDAQNVSVINELFEQLRVGDIKDYSFSVNNVRFGKLNQGIQSPVENASKIALNYEDSMEVTKMIDVFMAEFVDTLNKGLKSEEIYKLSILRKDLDRKDLSIEERKGIKAEIHAIEYAANKTNKFTAGVTNNQNLFYGGLAYAQAKFEKIQEDLNERRKEEKDFNKQALLNKDYEMITFVLENFGSVEHPELNVIEADGTIFNVIPYYMQKNEVFLKQKVQLENENDTETDLLVKATQGNDRMGNESSLIDLAKAEVLYLLKTLPKRDDSGNVKRNRFNVPELIEFRYIWNTLARTLQNVESLDQMYEILKEQAVNNPDIYALLDKMGDPTESTTLSEHLLWSNFRQTFNKSRISLIQMTVSKDSIKAPYRTRIGEAFNADYTAGKLWDSNFIGASLNEYSYIKKDSKGNYLDTTKLLQDFDATKVINNPRAFFEAIGITLSKNLEINKQLEQHGSDMYNPLPFYKKIVAMHNKGIVRSNTVTNTRIEKVSDFTEDLEARYKRLQTLESKFSNVFSTFMVTNAEGNTQFEHTLNNSMTVMVNSINNVDTYQDLMALPHMQHLNVETNPFAESSIWLKSMFYLDVDSQGNKAPNYGQRRKHKATGEYIKLKVENLSGVLVKDNETDQGNGVASANADEYSKLIYDIHLAHAGKYELLRHADKGTSFTISLTGPILGTGKKANNQYIDAKAFSKNGNHEIQTLDRILPHIIAEMKRIKMFQQMKEKGVQNFDFNYLESGLKFNTFHDIIVDDLLDDLMWLIEKEDLDNISNVLNNHITLKNRIQEALTNYLDVKTESIKTKLEEAKFLSPNILTELRGQGVASSEVNDVMVKSFVYNNWIFNLESISFLYGDTAQYKHHKEEFHKRNAGIGSTGTTFRTDSIIQNYINNSLWEGSYAAKHAKRLGITKKHEFTGRVNTAVMENMAVTSVYIKEYKAAIGDKADGYGKEQDEADAQGIITFDTYRQLKVAEGSWTLKQEALYKKIISGEDISIQDAVKFFPVMKAQYWGPLQSEHMPVTAFHKYSLFPMIPSVIKDTNMETVHDRMVKENIGYATFQSGSKISTITKSGKNDQLYTNPNGSRVLAEGIGNVETMGQDIQDPDYVPHFTPNIIHLEYLKNQLEIHDEYKGKVIFSTQLRKLVEDGLMKNGVPTDFMEDASDDARMKAWDTIKTEAAKIKISPQYALIKKFEESIDALTEHAKNKLLKDINWRYEGKGKNKKLKGDAKNLLTFVRKELDRQDIGEHGLNFLEVGRDGKIKHDLSLSLNVEKIEKMLTALMVKRLVKQKVNGEALIQLASTLMEDGQQTTNFSNPTEQDLAEYGSNDLPFYRQSNLLPAHKINNDLVNSEGGKALAATTKEGVIELNPVKTALEFFNYFTGKNKSITSKQKKKVLERLKSEGWSLQKIKRTLDTPKKINEFLLFHEQSHLTNNDRDVYFDADKNNKEIDWLSEDKITIETRATVDALEAMENRYAEKLSEKDIEARIKEILKSDAVSYTEDDGNLCKAEKGAVSNNFTKGSKWTLKKDLTGKPSHAKGGVQLSIGDNGGVHFAKGDSAIHAKHGLVIAGNHKRKK